jgi:hypothetical protein
MYVADSCGVKTLEGGSALRAICLSSSSGATSVVAADERASHSGSCRRLRSPAVASAKRERRESFRRPAAGASQLLHERLCFGGVGVSHRVALARVGRLRAAGERQRPERHEDRFGGRCASRERRCLRGRLRSAAASLAADAAGLISVSRKAWVTQGDAVSAAKRSCLLERRRVLWGSALGAVGLSLRRRVDGALGCHREELHRFGGVAMRGASVRGEVVSATPPSG